LERIGSGIVGWFAVGCPVCNRIVVALLGASGGQRCSAAYRSAELSRA